MTNNVSEIVRLLRDRLAVIDGERNYILGLLGTYGEDVVQPRIVGMPSSYSAPSFPPVPESEKVRLVKDKNGRTGITPIIVNVARAYPGLDISQLTTRVFEHITGDVPPSRDNMRNMIKYAVDHSKLIKREERYYAAQPAEAEEAKLL